MTALATAERANARPAPARDALVPLLVAAALAGAMLAPLWLLLLLPLALGVPHVVGDLRVLWLQRTVSITTAQALAVAAPLLAMTALRALAMAGHPSPAAFEVACGVLAVAAAAALGAPATAARRRLVAPVLLLGLVAIAFPRATMLLLAHAHNLVAFAVFAGRARNRGGLAATVVCYLAAWAVVLLAPGSGADGDVALGLRWSALTGDLAPGLDGAFADRLVRSFAFAQAVHYGLWTWTLPRARGTTLQTELGTRGLLVCIALSLLVPVLALQDPVAVRTGYLSLAIAHGWFELAALAFLFTRRRGTAQ